MVGSGQRLSGAEACDLKLSSRAGCGVAEYPALTLPETVVNLILFEGFRAHSRSNQARFPTRGVKIRLASIEDSNPVQVGLNSHAHSKNQVLYQAELRSEKVFTR